MYVCMCATNACAIFIYMSNKLKKFMLACFKFLITSVFFKYLFQIIPNCT